MNPTPRGRAHVLLRELSSNPREVDNFCRDSRDFLTGFGLSAQIFPVEMLFRESLNNAMIHGNVGDCEKKVRAELRVGRKWIILRVMDEGRGFNCRKVRRAVPDPNSTCGRGLAIYAMYAHRVSFNTKGNQVSFWRAVTGDRKL